MLQGGLPLYMRLCQQLHVPRGHHMLKSPCARQDTELMSLSAHWGRAILPPSCAVHPFAFNTHPKGLKNNTRREIIWPRVSGRDLA